MPLAAFSALEVEHNALDAKEQEKRRVKQEQRKQKKSEVKKSTQQQLQQAGATLGHASAADAGRAHEQPSALVAAAPLPVAGGASGMTALLQLIYAVIAYLQALLGLSPARKKAKKRPKAAVSPGSEEQQQQPLLATLAAVAPAVSSMPAAATVLPAAAAAAAIKVVDRGMKEGAHSTATAAASVAKVPAAAIAAHPEPLQREQAPKHRPAAEPSSDKGHPSKASGDGWAQGRFIVAEADGSHSDVVAAVALAGDVALTSGYDGAIKVWHWPVAGSGGGYSRPEHVRNLTGHSGRIEAVSLDGAKGRAASSGRDSTLKVG